jgi:NAD(P)H-nitrite reductase large subunit
MRQIVIIGNGISGVTAARHIRKKSDDAITIISSETDYFFSRTALMYVYMGQLKFEHTQPYEASFWKKNRIGLLREHVERIDTGNRTLIFQSGKSISYDVLILATGSRSNHLDCPGEQLNGVQGLYSYQDLQQMEENTRDIHQAVVVGGGLIGVELAEMLHARGIHVTMLVREPEFWSAALPLPDAHLISRHIRKQGVNLLLNTELREIHGDTRVQAVVTNQGDIIPCQFVAVAVGVTPNTELARQSGITTNRGIMVNEYLETNIPGIYAIGDCAERANEISGRRNIEAVWYTGRMMGEVVAATITGHRTTYHPGPWFNSAKFFEIEYQTYGQVSVMPLSHEMQFYWEHEDHTRAIHVAWRKDTGQFLGINTFGIRMRHEVFDRWLRQGVSVNTILEQLEEANFDPEFFVRHEPAIRYAFRAAHPQLIHA